MNMVDLENRIYSPFAALQACLEIVIGSQDAQDLCGKVVHSKLFSPTTMGAWVFRVENNGLTLVELTGYGKPVQDGLVELPMWDENPISQSVQTHKYVFSKNTLDEYGVSLGAIPIIANGVPIASFVLVMNQDTKESPVGADVLESFGSLISSLLTKGKGAAPVSSLPGSAPGDLTSRQVIILGHMSDGLTNLEISSKVLLSESTVRQETIRIYRALGVSNRTEAVAAARKLQLIPSVI